MSSALQNSMPSMANMIAENISGMADNPFVSARSRAKNERVKQKLLSMNCFRGSKYDEDTWFPFQEDRTLYVMHSVQCSYLTAVESLSYVPFIKSHREKHGILSV